MFVRWFLLGAAFLMASPAVLVYNAAQGASRPAHGGFSLTFDIAGPADITAKLRAANVVLGIEKLTIQESGRRTILSKTAQGNLVRLDIDSAKVNGTFQGKPFQYDFASRTPPANLSQDAVKQLAFNLSIGGRNFTLGSKGEYVSGSADDDAGAEAMSVIIDAPVRLPDQAVSVGQQWTREWNGTRAHKENGGIFHYKQTASLKSLDAASGRAVIAFTTNGHLEIPAGKNTQNEDTGVEARGTVTLDTRTGMIVAVQSDGALTTTFGGGALKLTRRIESAFADK